MLSRIIVLVVAGVAVVYIVRFIDNFSPNVEDKTSFQTFCCVRAYKRQRCRLCLSA